jgi:hypothetical protein
MTWNIQDLAYDAYRWAKHRAIDLVLGLVFFTLYIRWLARA